MKTSCNWPVLRVCEIATVNPRRDVSLRTMDDQLSATFVPMAAVDEISGTIASPELKTLGELRKGFTPFQEDDVIFAKITPCMQNGKSAVARGLSNGLGFGSTEFHVLRCGRRVLPEWLWYFLRQRSVKEDAQRNFRGSAGQQRVPAEFLRQIGIPVPGRDEQSRLVRRIDECIERIDEIRRLREGGSRESKAIELAIFHDLLHDGKGVPHWPFVRLGELTKSSRYGLSSRAHLEPVGVPILRMGNIVGGYLDFSVIKYVELPDEQKRKYRLRPGDVLINRTNSQELVGKAATFDRQDGEWVYASYLVRIQVDTRRVLPEFVTATINSRIGREYVLNTARRAIGMVNINAKEMAGIPISLPPREVQRELVDRLAEVRRISQQVRSGLGVADADHLSSAVLRKAFAGEL